MVGEGRPRHQDDGGGGEDGDEIAKERAGAHGHRGRNRRGPPPIPAHLPVAAGCAGRRAPGSRAAAAPRRARTRAPPRPSRGGGRPSPCSSSDAGTWPSATHPSSSIGEALDADAAQVPAPREVEVAPRESRRRRSGARSRAPRRRAGRRPGRGARPRAGRTPPGGSCRRGRRAGRTRGSRRAASAARGG